MLKNYIKTAFRNLVKNKFYTFINVAGLTAGLTVGILILIWVQNELSYDRFHTKGGDIYKVLSNMGKGESRQIWPNSHAPISVLAKAQVPEVKNAVRIKNNHDFSLFTYHDRQFSDLKKAYIDPSFFSIFDFKLLKGALASPFTGNNSIIISVSTAKRFFNDQDALGRILISGNKSFVVSGIVQDFPENSSMQYDMLFPMSLYASLYSADNDGKNIDQDWGNFGYDTFLQLQPGANVKLVQEKMAAVLVTNFKDIGISDPYGLQPLHNMHLYQTDGSEGLIQIVRIFILVGLLILVIACINYVNLSTARLMLRSKEVSIRKIIGAGRTHLFVQFFIETALVFVLASALAMLLAELLIPLYNEMSGKTIIFSLSNPQIWSVIGITISATLALSSIYPAWLLSRIDPLSALKGKFSASISAALLRKTLVTVQFIFSVGLIAGTLIIDRQLTYIHEKELGYDKQHVFTLGMEGMLPHAKTIKAELLKQQGVQGVTFASEQLLELSVNTGKTEWDGKALDRAFFIHPIAVDQDFLPVFKLQLAAGHGFKGIASDSAHFILNETAVKEAGISDPVGKRFKLWDQEGTIIGVVKDFHFASLKQKIEPSIFTYAPENYQMYVKTNGKDAAEVIASVEKLWKLYNPELPFEYSFMDQAYDGLYKSEQRIGLLFNFFSVVAIFIACLGLFALTAYTAQVKTKEIGIRKVLGATTINVVRLLAKDFMPPVLIAIVIAIPPSWYALNNWLQGYAYRIDLHWWMFVLAGLVAIVIALITVSFQSVKAALMSPVKSLRSE